ncbi:MAG TPA: 3-dehydroquinate synthase [Smithellaceae bacterium]|nr:3-dehydroquinate synthase [Smithellaceae bacterium]HRS88886.1 3-dehydroquinate synthase [Smithellaceae bacterium]HRV26225.1 3-dehydroquinate synthase [Smithellaceae bacterium]
MRSIKVNLDKKYSSSYEIRIGRGILDRIALLIAKNHKAGRYVIITDDNVARLHGGNFLALLKNIGLAADLVDFPAGEGSKNIGTIIDLADKLLKLGADRSTCLIALGGGVAGDMAGFIASVYMRGVPYLQIPTTLVAQVDSAIGGKTAIDLTAGKNLLGTFYQPAAVFADLNFLDTLPAKEFENGLAEIIKYAIIDDEKMFVLLEENIEAVRQKESTLLIKIIENCCRIKKSIVEIDEREQGLRRILNYGHTLGHALEAVSAYKLTHGAGVALGMIAAARISFKMKYLHEGEAKRIEELIRLANLPTKIPASLPTEEIITRLQMDKKKRGDTIHFVLLKKIGMPFINGGVEKKLIGEVVEEMKNDA